MLTLPSQSSHVTKHDGQDKTIFDERTEQVKSSIGYQDFEVHDMGLVDELVKLILDTLMTEGKTIRIGGEAKQRVLVQAQFLELNHEDIQHVIKQYKGVTTPITKVKQYLLTILYNCKMERKSHEANHAIFD